VGSVVELDGLQLKVQCENPFPSLPHFKGSMAYSSNPNSMEHNIVDGKHQQCLLLQAM